MIEQTEFALAPRRRGIHLVTGDILRQLPALPRNGLLNLLVKHTSAALALNENADPPTIPITDGRLNLGTWQGIYLCEFRDYGGSRKIVATVMGE